MANMLSYSEKDTWIHNLCGVTKLLFFLLWSVVGMITYDTRILAIMFIISIILFVISKTEYKQISTVVKVIFGFLVINVLAIFLFAPLQGVEIYHSKSVLFTIAGNYVVTKEQLFYEGNVVLKYFTVMPVALIFLLTTNPSEFASSLNKIGVKYSIGYSVAIALRYIPDVQTDFREIKTAQEARGIDMSTKVSLPTRIKSMLAIIFPLIFTSLEKIDMVSNAMELRGFGKNKKRTWYSERRFQKVDYMSILFVVIFCVVAMIITFSDGSRFYNPFQ